LKKYLVLLLFSSLAFVQIACYSHRTVSGTISEDDVATMRATLQAIDNGNKYYFQYVHQNAHSIDELIEKKYVTIDDEVLHTFSFVIEQPTEQARIVRSTSNRAFKGGPGWLFVYDGKTEELNISH